MDGDLELLQAVRTKLDNRTAQESVHTTEVFGMGRTFPPNSGGLTADLQKLASRNVHIRYQTEAFCRKLLNLRVFALFPIVDLRNGRGKNLLLERNELLTGEETLTIRAIAGAARVFAHRAVH